MDYELPNGKRLNKSSTNTGLAATAQLDIK